MRKISFVLFLTIFNFFKIEAQCTGSLGDPVFKQNFGAGSNPGSSLGASTNYGFVTNACPNDGFYTVRNQTNGCFGAWHTLTEDHTSGDVNGHMMIVNAANSAGEFYKQTITGLCPGTGYEFSVYVVNLLRSNACTSNPNRFPKLTFRIESPTGALLGTFSTANIPTVPGTATITPAQWSRQALFFTSTTSSVVLKLINNAPGGCGNDLALDDIEFRPCGPTLLATISGATSICEGSDVTLNTSLSGGYTSPTYQWQTSNDNINFSDIAGQTNSTLTQTPTSGIKYYRLLAAESGNIGNTKCRVSSNVIQVNVNTIPSEPTSAGADYCQNQTPSALTASSPGTLTWYGTNATGGSGTATQTPTTSTVGTTNYYVSTTLNNCESPRTAVPVVVNPLPVITASVSSIPCNGGTGTIISNASEGTPAYTFSSDGMLFQAGNVFTGLIANTYTISIKDAKGCLSTTSVTIPSGNILTISGEVENTCAIGNNGKITANGSSSSVGALTYNIDGGAFSSTNVFTDIASGSHIVKVKDVNGCEAATTVVVPLITSPTLALTSASTCVVGSTGTIVVEPSNGTPAYQYSIDGINFQSSNTFANNPGGAYTVTVKDSRACTSTTAAVITSKPDAPIVSGSPASYCFGSSAMALSASGVDLLWYSAPSGGVGTATLPAVNTSLAGIQNFYVSQTISSCESDRSVIIANVSPSISLNLSKIDACNSLSNGKITAVAAGGTSPLNYSINGGSFGGADVFENLAAGNYSITVSDANGCTATANISVAAGPTLSVTGSFPVLCVEVAAGVINATGLGGSGALQYKLNNGDYSASNTFTDLNAGDFILFVKDAAGCEAQTSVTLKSKPLLIASSNSPECQVVGSNIIALEALDAGTGATYEWSGPAGFTSTDQNPTIVYTLPKTQQGVYSVTVTLDGCTSTATVDVQCPLNPLPLRLVSLAASQFENDVIINWEASDIYGFDKFELEKSKDAKNFEKIHIISFKEDIKEKRFFSYNDKNPFEKLNYYRLKMIDLSGDFEYSKIIAVNFEKNGEYVSIVNPSEDTEIQVLTNIEKPQIKLISILGQEIKTEIIKTEKGIKLKGDFKNYKIVLVQILGETTKKVIRVMIN